MDDAISYDKHTFRPQSPLLFPLSKTACAKINGQFNPKSKQLYILSVLLFAGCTVSYLILPHSA